MQLPPHKPHWWPENEPWPPHRHRPPRFWRGGMPKPFFRRVGCLFGLFNIAGLIVLISAITYALDYFGLAHSSFNSVFSWLLIPAGLIFSFFIFGLLVFAAIRLRRMSMPLDEMLEALKKLAEGDYSVRMGEAGWPEVRQMARGFNSMVEKMGENDQQRRNMLADISHELRNPISVIQGNLEGMLDGVYSPDQAQLKSLYEETQMLSRLVDDLKTFALAEAGALPLKREPTDIGALVRDTVSTFEAQAKEKGILLQVQSAYSGDVDIDPLRIREVLVNLLANAIRHTPRGGEIRLGVSETSRGEERSVTVVVHDNGPGVESADLGHIFDRFYKSSDSGGMGLGLSIAKVLVEAHGGRIWAENEGGAKISFSLVQ